MHIVRGGEGEEVCLEFTTLGTPHAHTHLGIMILPQLLLFLLLHKNRNSRYQQVLLFIDDDATCEIEAKLIILPVIATERDQST